MPSKRVATRKETIKVRRLPAPGEPVALTATVVKVHDQIHPQIPRKVTLRVPGYPIPITISERELHGTSDD